MNRHERNDALFRGVQHLLVTERLYAAEEHGECYNSPAEGYMVVREEILELADNLDYIAGQAESLDKAIRHKDSPKIGKDAAADIENIAVAAAIEAIHVAAAAQKLLHSYDLAPTKYFEAPGDDE